MRGLAISLINQYNDDEFAQIVANSFSYKECLKQMGYNSASGATVHKVQARIEKLHLDISHFSCLSREKRDESNIFILNSTADQTTLRKWYLKGNYSTYECAICGQQPFWNGKKMTLILDHIDGHNKNNILSNLRWVCGNCNTQLETTNGKNKQHKEHIVNHCVDCGKPIGKHAIRCCICNGKFQSELHSLDITREELKKLIRTTSFVQIGKKFNVTDNAIRKWCDKYHLPKRSIDIKKYTDEEWEKI